MITGFTAGAWDLLHAGHVIFLRQCKEQCDILVVGLHIDPSIERKKKNKPVQGVWERYVQLDACEYVGSIVPYETEIDLLEILETYQFDKRFLGSDYKSTPEHEITGYFVKGTEVVFIDRFHQYSSSKLRNRLKEKI